MIRQKEVFYVSSNNAIQTPTIKVKRTHNINDLTNSRLHILLGLH